MQVLKLENLQGAFAQIDSLLSNVEVKGDSVQHVFRVRNILKDLYPQIEEMPVEEKEIKQEGG